MCKPKNRKAPPPHSENVTENVGKSELNETNLFVDEEDLQPIPPPVARVSKSPVKKTKSGFSLFSISTPP